MAGDKAGLLIKLLELEAELLNKLGAVHQEMQNLVSGGESIGGKVARLKKSWQEAWALRYKTTYEFTNHAMVGATLKRWLKHHTEEEIAARMFTFAKTDDPFYVRTRHSFEVFVKAFNQMAGLPASVGEESADRSAQRARELRGV